MSPFAAVDGRPFVFGVGAADGAASVATGAIVGSAGGGMRFTVAVVAGGLVTATVTAARDVSERSTNRMMPIVTSAAITAMSQPDDRF